MTEFRTLRFWVATIAGVGGLMITFGVMTPEQVTALTDFVTTFWAAIVALGAPFGYLVAKAND